VYVKQGNDLITLADRGSTPYARDRVTCKDRVCKTLRWLKVVTPRPTRGTEDNKEER